MISVLESNSNETRVSSQLQVSILGKITSACREFVSLGFVGSFPLERLLLCPTPSPTTNESEPSTQQKDNANHEITDSGTSYNNGKHSLLEAAGRSW